MSFLPSSDSPISENSAPEVPAAALPSNTFDSQTAKAGIKKFAALWPFMPPVALFGIAFAFVGAPLPTPIGSYASSANTSVISASEWVVPASQTMIVSKQAASGYAILRGRLRAPQGEIVTAPSRGQVARVMARVGQVVKAGDPLVLISRGTVDAPASTSPLEQWSTQAENAQIAAARQQEALEKRMSGANERLEKAQTRVAQAQTRVAQAREMIKILQSGREVGREEVAEKTKVVAPAPTAARPKEAVLSSDKARAEAARESQQLQKNADVAEAKAKAAVKEAKTANEVVGQKQSQLKTATAALAEAKSAPKNAPAAAESDGGNTTAEAAPRPSTPDITQETKAIADARQALAAATSRAAQLNREASKLQARATELRSNANDAARRAMEKLQVFENESAAPPTRVATETAPRDNPNSGGKSNGGGGKITIAEAVSIARQAMKESDEAIAAADRIRREVSGYERPVSGTLRRVDDATRRLENAQQQIWSAAGATRPNITQITASASGTLLSLSSMTNEVNFGQTVAVIGRPDRLEVTIQDASGMWKSLKPDARVLALVKTGLQSSGSGSTPALARPASDAPILADPTMQGTPTLARVVGVQAPLKPGGPATIRIAVHNPPRNGNSNMNGTSPRAFAPGMGVLFSLAKPGKRVMIRVPAASIRRDENGKTMVAVLSPLPGAPGSESPSGAGDTIVPSTDSTVAGAGAQLTSACRVEWREVQVGAGDGFNNQILTGLQAGERVALRPDALYDFTLAYGAQATVRVEQT